MPSIWFNYKINENDATIISFVHIQFNLYITCILIMSLIYLDPGCLAKFQRFVFNIIYNPFAVLFIIICILLNTLFMALDHHDMSSDLEKVLIVGNYVSFKLWFAWATTRAKKKKNVHSSQLDHSHNIYYGRRFFFLYFKYSMNMRYHRMQQNEIEMINKFIVSVLKFKYWHCYRSCGSCLNWISQMFSSLYLSIVFIHLIWWSNLWVWLF